MGLTKAWLMEQAENERFDEVRQWLKDRLGREPTVAEVSAAWDDFELYEAYECAANKDD